MVSTQDKMSSPNIWLKFLNSVHDSKTLFFDGRKLSLARLQLFAQVRHWMKFSVVVTLAQHSTAQHLHLDVSVKMVNSRWKSGALKTGLVINAPFSFANASSQLLVHWILSAFFLCVRSDKGAAISLNLGITN